MVQIASILYIHSSVPEFIKFFVGQAVFYCLECVRRFPHGAALCVCRLFGFQKFKQGFH